MKISLTLFTASFDGGNSDAPTTPNHGGAARVREIHIQAEKLQDVPSCGPSFQARYTLGAGEDQKIFQQDRCALLPACEVFTSCL